MKNNRNKIIVIGILTIVLILNFAYGILTDKKQTFNDYDNEFVTDVTFDNFQDDSEYLVLSKIFEDKYNINKSKFGLALVTDNESNRSEDLKAKIQQYDIASNELQVGIYRSQVGLQGHIFSFLYNKLHIPFKGLNLICSILMGITAMALCYFLVKKYNKVVGAIFYLTFIISPWVVAFAKNLYWVEFTWFLPAVFGLILSLKYTKKRIWIPLIGLAVFLKCLCGYEYLTAVMLLTISFFIIDFFIAKDKKERIKIFKTTFIVGIVCLLAFSLAIIIQAIFRDNGNILQGIKEIYKEDFLRRTGFTGNAHEFTGVSKVSIESTFLQTISRYFAWKTPIITGVPGKYFNIMIALTLIILIYDLIRKKEYAGRDIVMYIVFLSVTLSWFIFGKAHSYVHTHMNYVLWYFGYIQMCLYVIVQFGVRIIDKVIYKVKEKKKISS